MRQITNPTAVTLNKEQLITLVHNGVSTLDALEIYAQIRTQATGYGDPTGTVLVAEDSTPILQFTPRYLATAIRGAKLIVQCLTTNAKQVQTEFEDYSFIRWDTHTIIWGTCNFDQLDNGYTPLFSAQLGYALYQ